MHDLKKRVRVRIENVRFEAAVLRPIIKAIGDDLKGVRIEGYDLELTQSRSLRLRILSTRFPL